METRRLGRIGHESSVLIYGGAALSDASDEVADRSIAEALDAGINHLDTAAGYGDSELHLGRWMPRIRDRIFLATKTGERSAARAYDGIRRSLERLRTDRVDLLQLHAVGDLEDLGRATSTGGAVDGAVRAREEGLVGAIGITGHGMGAPATHLEALRRFPFDTVLTPFNHCLAREPAYLRDFDALAERTEADDVGLMVIKSIARNLWPATESGTSAGPRRSTWYEPLEEPGQIDAAVAFVLARREVTGICTAGDVHLLARFVDAERTRSSLSAERIEGVLAEITEYEPPFVRVPGRTVPDWLEPLVPD
jgi:aryl-alcohol dehydrogenase-like predicted oxidoreductase